jgi:hypothetical protein
VDRVILDTDVSSFSLKRRLPSPALTRLIGKQPCITFVTLGEPTQWAELRRWGRRNRISSPQRGRRQNLGADLRGILLLRRTARTYRYLAVAMSARRSETVRILVYRGSQRRLLQRGR